VKENDVEKLTAALQRVNLGMNGVFNEKGNKNWVDWVKRACLENKPLEKATIVQCARRKHPERWEGSYMASMQGIKAPWIQ
jgi:hypothetical protein